MIRPAASPSSRSAPLTPVAQQSPGIELSPCWFTIPAAHAARCGWLVARERPGVADGRFVRLPFVIFQSPAGDGAAPLVFISGGPGEPAGLDADGVERWWGEIAGSEWLSRQDLIVFDQRGAGLAEPSLKCPELQAAGYATFVGQMSADATAARWSQAALACSNRLSAAGIALDRYNTAASAEDLAALMGGLGYGAWNIYGVSYGTRLALAFMRTHPDGTRAVILDSVYPPNVHAYVEAPGNAAHAFAALFDDCARRATCRADNPHLDANFRDLVGRAAASPVAAPFGTAADEPQSGDAHVPLDSAKLIEVLFGGFYSWPEINKLPAVIAAAAKGDVGPLAPLVEDALQTYRATTFSYGLFLSVECHDDWSYDGPEAIQAAASGAGIFAAFARANLPVLACPVWGAGAGEAAFHNPVRSDAPTLILSGAYDPITPPAWADQAAQTLPHSYVIRFPGIGHGVIASHRCAEELAARFLDDPTKSPYLDCLIGVAAGPWRQSADRRSVEHEAPRRRDSGVAGGKVHGGGGLR